MALISFLRLILIKFCFKFTCSLLSYAEGAFSPIHIQMHNITLLFKILVTKLLMMAYKTSFYDAYIAIFLKM